MSQFHIRPLLSSDLSELKSFTDREIGENYYTLSELGDIFLRSQSGGITTSFVLLHEEKIKGIRLSYPPGNWSQGKGQALSENRWPHEKSETAYFQSLFLEKEYQAQGWGQKLSAASIEVLKKIGAKGVVCHSWKESPNNSSVKYLEKMGFKTLQEHPLYWKDVPYNCTRCLKPPCQCTAVEMYLDLEE